MDVIQLRNEPDLLVQWPNGGGFQQVEMRINGEPLLEIVRRHELPFAQQEWDERTASGESAAELGPRDGLAGDYLYLPPSVVYPPSQNFFGGFYDHGFVTEPDDPTNRKSLILQCTCGITDCWFLLASIVVGQDRVTWTDFQQFHRDWIYDGLEFMFDRKQYDDAFLPN